MSMPTGIYLQYLVHHTWLLFIILIYLVADASLDELPHNDDQVLESSACFSTSQTSLPLLCPLGAMVKLVRIFYGHSPSGGCAMNQDDCILDLQEEIYSCVGQQECPINMPTGSTGKVIPTCGKESTYIQAHYECIPEVSVLDICEHTVLESQSGYIKSPRYPKNHPTGRNCSLHIRTPYADQKIRLYIIDMDLETGPQGVCKDSLHVFDGYRDNTVCGSRSKDLYITSVRNTMDIRFYSDSSIQSKGFWLYYEAFPYINSTTVPPTTPTLLITNATVAPLVNVTEISSEKVTSSDDTKTTHLLNIKYTVGNFPLGLLLGVIFGAVLCILAIILLVLVLRSRRRPQAKVPNSLSNASTCSTAAFLADPKNNIEKAQCTNVSYRNCDLEQAPRSDQVFVEVNCKGQGPGHGLDLQSAKEIDKDVRVIENPGVLDYEPDPKKQWQGPYIDRDKRTGDEHLYC